MIPQPQIAPDELLPGSTLGKYEILRKLATGGMAEIYLARARGVAGFEKTVVLKRILPHVAEDESFVQMFLDEARLAATLQHPNIADVYDVGEVDGNPFFTMEYVHGQDVRAIRAATRKRDEQAPMAIALAIVHGTASALDYAHNRKGPDGRPLELVHRDVSSSNIVVSYDGAIKLLDFGIARAASHQHKTQVGMLKGKTPYMSPEQCRAQRIDRRSDLFSLGTILYELTVGRRPFRGENDFVIMEQIVHGSAAPPSAVAPGYPADLEAIVMRLLATNLDERYQMAEEVLHDLEELISRHGMWVSSRPLGKYMRLLFADRVNAWESAASEGVSLSEHVAQTITSESQRVERVTPSAHPRLVRLSQEIPAVRLPSREMPAVTSPFEELSTEPQFEPAAPAMPARPSYEQLAAMQASFEPVVPTRSTRPSYEQLAPDWSGRRTPSGMASATPDATPEAQLATGTRSDALLAVGTGSDAVPALRSGRPVLIALGILIVVGLVGSAVYAWPLLFPPQPKPAAAPAAPAEVAAPQPAEPGTPAQPATATQEAAPTTDTPAAPTPTTDTPDTPDTPAAAAAPTPDTPAATKPQPAPTPAPATKPAAAPKRLPKSPAKAPSRPSGKQPGSKDNAWDRDSPFLPPSS
ncbi:MAG TPA: serine/threonine-protein kinase [Kofleriaceae bacterium]|nr:serine/threonine-protein kinase [Kofleriaceae bacterium]